MNIVTSEARPHFQLTGPGDTWVETLAAFISEATQGSSYGLTRTYHADRQTIASRFDVDI